MDQKIQFKSLFSHGAKCVTPAHPLVLNLTLPHRVAVKIKSGGDKDANLTSRKEVRILM